MNTRHNLEKQNPINTIVLRRKIARHIISAEKVPHPLAHTGR
jgi:hypothetical protein